MRLTHDQRRTQAARALEAQQIPGGFVDDGIPLLKPISCGREGEAPLLIRLPSLPDEAFAIADHLASAHKEGFAWGNMAVLCADWKTMDLCASALAQRKLPHRVRKKSGEYRPGTDAI